MSSKRYKLAYAPIEDSDVPAHLRSLIRVFKGHIICSKGFNVLRRKTKTLTRLCVCWRVDDGPTLNAGLVAL